MGSIGIVCFTQRGAELAARLASALPEQPRYGGSACQVHVPARLAQRVEGVPFSDLGAWTAEHFTVDDALVFVGAAGIAVRAIAPHVADKFCDPAVVSVDESGAFAVPLLSGHVGGANDLARAIARITGGQAAISTATDVNGVFAVDEWANRHGFSIVERDLAKRVSVALLEGQTVGFASDVALADGLKLPHGLGRESAELGIYVSRDTTTRLFPATLHLVPRTITVGVGCRKGADYPVVVQAVDAALADARVSVYEVAALATIDVKQGEPAIERLAAERGWDLRFYTAEELAQVPGTFLGSAFVEQTVGVDNVCERAACAGGGRLIVGKRAGDGVTVALAALRGSLVIDSFEGVRP